MRDSQVTHRAVVTESGDGYIVVRLDDIDSRQCQGCSMAMACGTSAATPAPIRIELVQGSSVPEPGNTVHVRLADGARRRAVHLLFTVPLLDFLVVAVICTVFGLAPWLTALLSFGAAALCFVQLYMARRKMKAVWTLST